MVRDDTKDLSLPCLLEECSAAMHCFARSSGASVVGPEHCVPQGGQSQTAEEPSPPSRGPPRPAGSSTHYLWEHVRSHSRGTTTMKSFPLIQGLFLLLCWSRSCNGLAGWRSAATPIASVQHRERSLGSAWPHHARQRRRCAKRERDGGGGGDWYKHECVFCIGILLTTGKGLTMFCGFVFVDAPSVVWHTRTPNTCLRVDVPTAVEPLHPLYVGKNAVRSMVVRE